MDEKEDLTIDDEVKDPEEVEPTEPETPVEPEKPVEKQPLPNSKAIENRDNIVKELETQIPEAINSMVSYIDSLIASRSKSEEPSVTVGDNLLSLALPNNSVYPSYDKELIITSTVERYKNAGYDTALIPTETQQKIPSYIIKLKRDTRKM